MSVVCALHVLRAWMLPVLVDIVTSYLLHTPFVSKWSTKRRVFVCVLTSRSQGYLDAEIETSRVTASDLRDAQVTVASSIQPLPALFL